MIGHAMYGTNDLDRAMAFYDAVFAEIGVPRTLDVPGRFAFYGHGPREGPGFAVGVPADGGPATPGNGTMISIIAPDQHAVQRVHARALELGAVDEGAPGPRNESGLYAAFFRDLDGNKLCVFTPGD